MKIKLKKLHPDAKIPKYAKNGDAAMDLVAVEVKQQEVFQIAYDCGIAMEIPEGHVGLVFPRSSIKNYDLILANGVGVIDSGYRGSIQVVFNKKRGVASKIYEVGDRIAQLIILPYPAVEFEEVEELSETERGEGGFGSTNPLKERNDVTYDTPKWVTSTSAEQQKETPY